MTLMQEVDFLLDTICDFDFVSTVECSFVDEIEPEISHEVLIVMKCGAINVKEVITETLYGIAQSLIALFNKASAAVDICYIYPEMGDYRRYAISIETENYTTSLEFLHLVKYTPQTTITLGYSPMVINKRYSDIEAATKRVMDKLNLNLLKSKAEYVIHMGYGKLAGIIFNFNVAECTLNGDYFPIYCVFKEDTCDGLISIIVETMFKMFTEMCKIHCYKGWHNIDIVSGAITIEETIAGVSAIQQLRDYVN